MAIGDLIRKRRRELEMTQDALANACGVSQGAVAQWETHGSHKREPSERVRRILAKVLQIPIGELIAGADDATGLCSPKEAAVLALFRRLKPKQQDVHLSSLYHAVGIAEPVE